MVCSQKRRCQISRSLRLILLADGTVTALGMEREKVALNKLILVVKSPSPAGKSMMK